MNFVQNLLSTKLRCAKCGSHIKYIFSSPEAKQIMQKQIMKHFSGKSSPKEHTAMMKSLGGTCPQCGNVSCADCYGGNGQKCPRCGTRIPELAG